LRLFSFGGYGLALAALALVVFGAYDSYPYGYGLALAALALVLFGAYDSYPPGLNQGENTRGIRLSKLTVYQPLRMICSSTLVDTFGLFVPFVLGVLTCSAFLIGCVLCTNR